MELDIGLLLDSRGATRSSGAVPGASRARLRICADALVDAERRVEGPHRRAGPARASAQTSSICSKRRSTPGVTRFVWLRQFEPGSNSAYANRLLDRLEIPAEFLAHVSPLG